MAHDQFFFTRQHFQNGVYVSWSFNDKFNNTQEEETGKQPHTQKTALRKLLVEYYNTNYKKTWLIGRLTSL